MSLEEDLRSDVATIFRERWQTRNGKVVPDAEKLALGNEGVQLDATVLYADMSGSTALVDKYLTTRSAELYKTYLYCAAKAIRAEGGEITAYDGDRVMGIFVGDFKNTSAAHAAMKINFARCQIINPASKQQYGTDAYQIEHAVGIDSSPLMAARTGVRGANDLVWVGRAANYAAKLTELPASYTYITEAVYERLHQTAKESGSGDPMWQAVAWTQMQNVTIYRSNWWRRM
ncbi:MAG TPA: adenylate/guanylate cyclase domain-containing protein [Terriglobales bacterium]